MILSSTIIGKGPVLIILHGLFGESKNWLSIGKVLSDNFEVHLIDQRNHGNSFHHSEHNYVCLSEDLKNYTKQKNINKFSLVGHSMGGKVAMQFGLLYPKQLNKLIIIDIAPKTYDESHMLIFQGLKEVLLNSSSRKEAVEILKNYINNIDVVHFLLKSYYIDETNIPKFKFNLCSLEQNITHVLSCISKNKTFNKMAYFLKGEKSNYITSNDIKDISYLFPLFQIIDIKGAGHWIHFDQKDIFLNTLNNILNNKL